MEKKDFAFRRAVCYNGKEMSARRAGREERGWFVSDWVCDDEAGSRALLAGYARTLIQHQGLNFPAAGIRFGRGTAVCTGQTGNPAAGCTDGRDGRRDGCQDLREQGCGSIIILVTNYIQYAIDGYEFNAFHFLKSRWNTSASAGWWGRRCGWSTAMPMPRLR